METMCLKKILLVCCVIYLTEGSGQCPQVSKAHLTRCDMYYKCVKLPSDNHVWIPSKCPTGLIYETLWKMCVLPGDDWECHLGDIEMPTLNDDSDSVYGVNNLNYLQQQLKGYEAEISKESSSQEFEENDEFAKPSDTTPNDNNTSNASEDESSGDGATGDTETKSDFISIPTTNDDPTSTVSTQLQRLSQIINGMNNDHKESSDLGPDDLNEFLGVQKIKSASVSSKESVSSTKHARPFPSNGKINPNDMNQILDLQKKLNNLGLTRDALSTPATPVSYSISGSGYYPSDATTVHIKTATAIKNPRFPEPGFSQSQIVVNRPDGSVLFSLPNVNVQQQHHEQQHKKEASTISEETLRKLLELSKQMSTTSQPSNVPGFIEQIQQSIQPIFYNIPLHTLPIPILTNYQKTNNYNSINQAQDVDNNNNKRPMQKISSVSGHLDNDAMNLEHQPNDIGLSTIIHNRMPITIGSPNPTHSIVNQYQGDEHTNSNNNYPYPAFEDAVAINRPLPSYNNQSPYRLSSTQATQPHYIQISQSQPDSQYSPYNQGVMNIHQPVPTFSSDESRYTTKFYTPSPHLNNHNVNHLVPVEQTYQTLQPTSFIANHRPSYTPTAPTYLNRVTGYSASSPKIVSSERPYEVEDDDDDDDDNYGNMSNESQDDVSGSAEQTSNEEYGNTNTDQSSENEDVMNLVANYKYNTNGPTQSIGGSATNEKKPLFEYGPAPTDNKHKQFVNLGGNFISLESYQNSIEPYLPSNSMLSTHIEVLTCATGVRQANTTDCTRYFVCNSKTGKVLSYSCPMYTAFNPDTKICNAKTYSECYPGVMKTEITIEQNKRIQQQAQMSLHEAQRIKHEALKAQQLAHMIKLETQKILDANKRRVGVGAKATLAPARPTRVNKINQTRKGGKRRIPCRMEGKLPDNLSKYNYFLCFKDKSGKMRARKLLCPAKLIFCASSKVCTSTQRCNQQ